MRGIPPEYIRRKGAEAISAMKQYQADVEEADLLRLKIGSNNSLGKDTRALNAKLGRLEADIKMNPVHYLVEQGLFTSITEDIGIDEKTIRGSLLTKAVDKTAGKVPKSVVRGVQELYMLPGSTGFKLAVAATQYGDFVGRFIKYNYDTQINKMSKYDAINSSLAAFIYYDIPQNKNLQYLNDTGFLMFTKFFFRIQHIVARMYVNNPVSAFGSLAIQQALFPKPFNSNIAEYGLGSGLTHKPSLNPFMKAGDTLNPSQPALLDWVFSPFGL